MLHSARAWRAALDGVDADVYHTFDYAQICSQESGNDAHPVLLSIADGGRRLLWPLLIRQGELDGKQYIDAGSVYGFPGPIRFGNWFTSASQQALRVGLAHLAEQGIVSMVSRLNPLLDDYVWLGGPVRVRGIGPTVVLDLTLDEERQWRQYRQNHRRGISALRRAGVTCQRESPAVALPVFSEIYRQTMTSVGAGPEYFFSDHYFRCLVDSAEFEAKIYVCRHAGAPLCAGIFLFGAKTVHYHLGGTAPSAYHLAPTKLMFDEVSRDARKLGMQALHLGGGLGGKQDSLFHFKAGFSKEHRTFSVAEAVLREDDYQELCALRSNDADAKGFELDRNYFPRYRAPYVTRRAHRDAELTSADNPR